jgi:phosphodiesterase/alkaline phosphatase D-like protein
MSARPRVSDRFEGTALLAARILGVFSVVAFVGWQLQHGIPANGEIGHWEALVHLALLMVVALGNAIAWRWEMAGALIMAFAGLSLVVVLAFQYDPTSTVPLALVFFAPAALHWLAWERHQSRRRVLALGGLLLAMLASATYLATWSFDYFYGPAHPESPIAALPPSPTRWVWSGGVTSRSAIVRAGVDDPTASRLIVARDEALEERVAVVDGEDAGALSGATPPGEVVSFAVRGLEPGTTYHYAVEVDGEPDRTRAGRFRTFPAGPGSFTIAVGSCGRLGSNGAVYDAIAAHDPLLYLQVGDLYYADIGTNDPDAFRDAFETTLASPAQSSLYRHVPIAYTWDDHDSGPNDADSTSDARPAAQRTYREYVPHYSVAPGESPIYQAFTVGRVRVVMMDTRSERSPAGEPDDDAKTMLGNEQQAWLEQELLASNGRFPVILLVTSVPWIHEASPANDDWSGYTTERAEIADFVADHDIEGLVMVGGDAHMVAIDDGSHSDYSSTGDAAFPVFHAGALDRHGSTKGGPYSEGEYPGAGQFGLIEVDDDGSNTIAVTLRGMTWEGEELASYRFTLPASGSTARP